MSVDDLLEDGVPVVSPKPAGIVTRDRSRSRRVLAVSCVFPLYDLQVSRERRGGIFPALDCVDIAIGAIDFVVDRMGFDTGADPEDLLEHLCAEVGYWVPEAANEEVEVAGRVLNEALIRPQRGTYSAADDPTRRPFDFALLAEEPAPEGVRVTATNEAINVLVGALDTDVASAHSAADAKLASLISRKRFGEAEQAARDARIRSIQYMTDVRRIIADTRLDVRRAGWDHDVPARLGEIVEHLKTQMDVETRMLEAMRDSRDEATAGLAETAHALVAVVEDCLNRHRELHNRVMEASETFFAEHARQAFQPTFAMRAVNILEELLVPSLRLGIGDAAEAVERFASGSWGIAEVRLASMDRLLDVLLADPRVLDGLGGEVPDEELGVYEDPLQFKAGTRADCEAAFDALDSPTRLSCVVADLRSSGKPEVAELAVLLSMQALDPPLEELRRRGSGRVLAAADDGERIDNEVFFGPDLLVGWLAASADTAGREG